MYIFINIYIIRPKKCSRVIKLLLYTLSEIKSIIGKYYRNTCQYFPSYRGKNVIVSERLALS